MVCEQYAQMLGILLKLRRHMYLNYTQNFKSKLIFT